MHIINAILFHDGLLNFASVMTDTMHGCCCAGGSAGYPPPAAGTGGYYVPPPAGYPGAAPIGGYTQAPPPMGLAGVPPGGRPYGGTYQGAGGPSGGKYGAGKPTGATMGGYDAEAAHAAAMASAFAEKKVRSAFVRKVFLLVLLQLGFTVGVASIFLFVNPVNEYVAGEKYTCINSDGERTTCRRSPDGAWVFYVSWALTLVMLIVLMCFTTIRRRYPYNYIAMFAFTAVMSVQVGTICAWWDLSVVLQAVAVTGGAVVGLSLAAIFLPWDLTKRGNILGMVTMVVFFIALITFFVGFFYVSKWWFLAISVIFALLFSAYLVVSGCEEEL